MNKLLLFIYFLFIYGFSLAQTEKQVQLREKFKAAPDKVYLSISNEEQNRSNRATIFYDDFSTPSNWTMTNTSSPSHDWEIVDSLSSSLQVYYDSTLNSTSGGNFGLFDTYSQSSSMYNANLTIVNPINCSSSNNVQLRFENYFFRNNEVLSVQVSNDGINYDTFFVNTINDIFPSENVEELIVDISSTAAFQTTVWIRFNYTGLSGFWAIDDIYVEDIPNYNLKFTKANIWNQTYDPITGSRMDYSVVPVSQIDNLVIGGTLTNFGLDTTTNSAIKYTVTNATSTVISSGFSSYSSIPSFTSLIDSAIWNTTTTIGNYTIDYTAVHDSLNENASNINAFSESYKIVPNSGAGSQYARDNDIPTGDGLWNGYGNGYIMGNTFTVYNTITAYTIDICFTQDSEPGVVACIQLYEIDATDGSFISVIDHCLDGIEFALQSYHFSSANNMNWQRICLNIFTPSQGVTLNLGSTYIAAISHYGGTEQMVIQDGGESVDPFTSWIFDQTDATWYYMTRKPKIRLGFDIPFYCFPSVPENFSENLSLSQNAPNPAIESTQIDYILELTAEVNFELVDVTGKTIYSEKLGNKGAGAYSFTLNTSDYANGIYFYSMSAGADKITKKMIIAH